jgi:uncharacterized protein (DUF2267 family)
MPCEAPNQPAKWMPSQQLGPHRQVAWNVLTAGLRTLRDRLISPVSGDANSLYRNRPAISA